MVNRKRPLPIFLVFFYTDSSQRISRKEKMSNQKISNDLQEILSHAITQMKEEAGRDLAVEEINLAELQRRTGISRHKLRKLKKDGFIVKPHGNTGKVTKVSVLYGYSDTIDELLKAGVSNSEVIFDRIKELGYTGSKTTVKNYIASHKDLLPAQRIIIASQGNRGRRYQTGPGESFQMDWGFVNVTDNNGGSYRVACFAMICHHCGKMYVEFFPNAKQENLFIGMIHSFIYLGIPKTVLTDNMKSVVIERDGEGKPIWQKDYEAFMKTIGFETKLCKVAHPFTKGKVERLIRFVKGNFLVGRVFGNITDLNYEALRWCNDQNRRYHKALDCVPEEKHFRECASVCATILMDHDVMVYLCPLRKISFDGFVNFEGRRFGVPYWYTERTCRVRRDAFTLYIYDSDLTKELVQHNVTWSRKDSFCKDQYALPQPEEVPSTPVKIAIRQIEGRKDDRSFDKFDFAKEAHWYE